MECNREEAQKAKEVAERKFRENDYSGARRFLEKAQRIFPSLEGLQPMCAVLDVHTIGQEKIGTDSNWYGILQVDPLADDSSIKKQYRKLALSLHPDKNNAVGAEAAFKMVSEAFSVLSDKGRRAMHDMRRKLALSESVKPSMAGTARKHSTAQPPIYPVYQPPVASFVVRCVHCSHLFHCPLTEKHKPVRCLKCQMWFTVSQYPPNNPMQPGTSGPTMPNFAAQGFQSATQGFAGFNGRPATGWPATGASGGGSQPASYPRPPVYTQQSEHYQKWQTPGGANLHPQQGGGPAMANGTGQPGKGGTVPPFGSDAYVKNVWETVQKQKADDAEKRKKAKEDKMLEKEQKRRVKEEEDRRKREEKEKRERERQELIAKAREAKEAARQRDLEILRQKRKEQDEKQDSRRREEGKAKGMKRRRKVKEEDEDEDELGFDVPLDDDVEIVSETRGEGRPQQLKVQGSLNGSGYVRRSSRKKAHVQYKVDDSDDEGLLNEPQPVKHSKPTAEGAEPGPTASSLPPGAAARTVPVSVAARAMPAGIAGDMSAAAPASTTAPDSAPSSNGVPFVHAFANGTGYSKSAASFPGTRAPQPASFQPNGFPPHLQPSTSHYQQKSRLQQKIPEMFQSQTESETVFRPAKQTAVQSSTNGHAHSSAMPEQGTGQMASDQGRMSQQQQNDRQTVSGVQNVHSQARPPQVTLQSTLAESFDIGKKSPVHEKPKEVLEVEDSVRMEVPDPDFHNFDNDRLETDILTGQVWALYDDTDGMPRFYARILASHASRRSRQWRIQWLEGIEETGKKLPDGSLISTGCGEFRLGKSGKQTSVGVFSHPIVAHSTSINGKVAFWIRPRKDEVWALFRQDVMPNGRVHGVRENETRELSYDLVLVLGDYAEPAGVEVCYLTKVAGFRTLFVRNHERASVRICPPNVPGRFSHKVPSHPCNGTEGPGVPPGGLEVDPASTPMELIIPKPNTPR